MKSINSNLVSDSVVRDLPPARAKTPKLTPWFSEGTKPARIGVYIASMGSARFYRYWDGRNWHHGSYDIRSATIDKPKWPYPQSLRWRGLASNPARKS